jgi:hypothetical protein
VTKSKTNITTASVTTSAPASTERLFPRKVMSVSTAGHDMVGAIHSGAKKDADVSQDSPLHLPE